VIVPPRLLAGARTDGQASDLERHHERYGALPEDGGLVDFVDDSGLQGRGGAGFPTGRKLRAVAGGRGRPIVVANGTEGEPVSGKDRVLLRLVPHLVLDGATLAAQAVGAREAIVAVGVHAQREVAVVGAAIAERNGPVRLRLATPPPGFVSGEETALVNWLNRGPAKPTFTPPRPFERGVGGRPTLVQNVETLANLALIARSGPGWFRELGTRAEPGTVLVTLGGAVKRPGIYEAPLGVQLAELVDWAGGFATPPAAFLVGGYFGTWLDADVALRRRLLDSDLSEIGASLGARGVFAFPAGSCGVFETARVARYLANESAGQCGPCVNGLHAIADTLENLAWGRPEREDPARLARWASQVEGRGACRHPDGAARFVTSALSVFADEIGSHLRGRCTGERRPLLPVGVR
jgi:NADH:ubiquinone oxidoreductase subunit F (NADH-binding)